MLMTNENVRLYPHDRLLARTLLRIIPKNVTPNHVTILRVLLTPLVLYYVWERDWRIAVLLFLFVALTDVIDGSLARTRKQITIWGTIADPVADKIFIGSVVLLFVAHEINPAFAVVILLIEVMILLTAIIRRTRRGEYISANWAGKVKMFLQCSGVVALLIAKWSGVDLFVPVSIGTLSLAIVFALVSLYTYGL